MTKRTRWSPTLLPALLLVASCGGTAEPASEPAPPAEPGPTAGAEDTATDPAEDDGLPIPMAAPVVVTGELTYRERIALPPGATAQIEIRQTLTGNVIASDRRSLEGAQVPITFSLRVLPGAWREGEPFAFRATIAVEGATRWVSEPRVFPARPEAGNLGTVDLVAYQPTSTAPPSAEAAALSASGVEPDFTLAIDAGTVRLERLGGEVLEAADPTVVPESGGLRYEVADGSITVFSEPAICRDAGTGMPHPFRVTIDVDDTLLHGCGGSPESLLVGGTWLVESIAGEPVVRRSRATLVFDADDDRVAGRTSCNRYGAGYTLTGETLTFAVAETTEMACAPALMAQERRFLAVLGAVVRFDLDDTGALTLVAEDDRTILARRDTAN